MARAGTVDDARSRIRFPAVRGRSLLGIEMALPGDFPAELTLAVIAFRQWHQVLVDRWIARAVTAGIPPTHRGALSVVPVAVVEVPVLAAGWRPVRRFIDGGMTAGIGNPDVLARTITVYTNVAAFQRSLVIPSSNEVHALIVRRDGTILARGRGEPNEASWRPLGAALGLG